MLEYQPLTDDQRRRLTPEQRAYWAESQRIAAEFAQLKYAGATVDDSPAWIEIMLAAGRRVQPRPSVSEAVAPYRRPATPATRDLTAAEAREALHRDWLHQADGNPDPREDSRRDPLDPATGGTTYQRRRPTRGTREGTRRASLSCSNWPSRCRVRMQNCTSACGK